MNVNLTKRILTPQGKRFCPVVQAANGRIKPDWVVVGGAEERHPEGNYFIDWTEKGKRHRVSVGKSASQAVARQLRKEAELKAISHGIEVVSTDETKRQKIDDAIGLFLEETKLTKKPKTFAAYTTALDYFRESCPKVHLDDLERRDMLHFTAFLRTKKKQSPRSCWNKFANVMTFLKAQGVTGIVRKGDWPDYVEEQPEVYEKEDLDKFFAVCLPNEQLVFQFFLMTGFRDQEVMYATWSDFKPKQSVVRMTWKPQYGWTPKAYKEREVPVPDTLVSSLEAARPEGGKGLIFGTDNDKPNFHFLEICKDIAKRAKLERDEWWLHKFRATFATWHLQRGVDLRTVQEWMGHVDLESTMRYLRPARSETVRDKVNATFA
jgi:integrase